MPASESEVLVGRRMLERGFLDAAMKVFLRNAEHVAPDDWSSLSERLLDRGRVADVIRVCQVGDVPLPRERLLAIADAHLRRKDLDATAHLYEVAGADRERWARLVDVLTGIPDRARTALRLAERHLRAEPTLPPRRMKAVK